MFDTIERTIYYWIQKGSSEAVPIALKVNAMRLVQIDNYILNHKGEVWCMESNECIYASTYADALEFLKNIAS